MPVNPYLLLCNLLFRKQPDFQPHNSEHNEKNLVYGRVRSLTKSSPTRYKSKTFQQNVDFYMNDKCMLWNIPKILFNIDTIVKFRRF